MGSVMNKDYVACAFETFYNFNRVFFNKQLLSGLNLELNHAEIMALIFLSLKCDNSMTAISKRVNLEKGSFTSVANKLEARGLIKRENDTSDKRVTKLTLTRDGEEFVKILRNHILTVLNNKIDDLLNEQEQCELF